MKCDVVMTFFGKEPVWGLVCQGLELNKEQINRVLVMADTQHCPTLSTPEGITMEIIPLNGPKQGWGAAERCNTGASLVDTEYFVHIDGDMMLASNSLKQSLAMAEPDGLLACQIHDTTKDAIVIGTKQGLRIRATKILPERRPGEWRKPTPLNLRHGHYLAHTKSFQELGGHDLTPPWDSEYHSIDYSLAARWMMKYGRESFEFGGGAAFHIGGIYDAPVPDAESRENKARTQAVLDEYLAKFPDEANSPRWFTA